jgi:aminopeptidase YwaD
MKKLLYPGIRYLFILTIFFSLTAFIFSDRDDDQINRSPEITASELFEHVKYLASEKMEGRLPGTEGDRLAQEYFIKEFREYGLQPGGVDGFIQPFNMVTSVRLGEINKFNINTGNRILELKVSEDFLPMGFSSNEEINAPLVFAGYGISAPDLNYDDYRDANGNTIDLTGKIAVIMRNSPTSKDPHNNKFQRYESIRYKTSQAKANNAMGIIFITGPASTSQDNLMRLSFDNSAKDAGISVVHLKRNLIEEIFTANGLDLNNIQTEIDNSLTPNSFEIKNSSANIKTSVIPAEVTTGNVIAFLEGSDPVKKNEVIVIGAHYDHVGYGEYGSLYSGSDKQIHYGADDNASGSAGVLEIAQKLAANKSNLERSYLFMLFAGEEAGLLGSAYFVKSDLFKKYNITAMLNMDMVGRMENNKLIIYGTGSSPFWESTIKDLNDNYKMEITYTEGGFGRSDHANFYRNDIPALHFFTGTHPDYHSPTDTYDKINSADMERVVNLVYDLALKLDKTIARPQFTKVETPTTTNQNQSMSNVSVYVGTIPDYSYQGDGLKISGVKEDSPADKGGLIGDDIIIKFGETDVKTIYDYMFAMGKYKVGDEVDIVVLRNGAEEKLKVKMGSR